MLVCNVSLRPPRRAIAAGLEEATTAVDDLATGNVVFATLVDDPASVRDTIDAYLGEIMLEAASATEIADAGLSYDAAVNETVTAGSTSDATVTAAPTGSTWNSSDQSANITLSNGNLTAKATTATDGAVRGTTSQGAGTKKYFEVTWSGTPGGTDTAVGIATGAANLGTIGTNATNAMIVVQDSFLYYNGSSLGISINSFSPIGNNTVCMAIDLSNKRFWARMNGGNWNGNATYNPATNVGGVDISSLFTSNAAFACASFNSTAPLATVNFGGSAFNQTPPSGFTAWG